MRLPLRHLLFSPLLLLSLGFLLGLQACQLVLNAQLPGGGAEFQHPENAKAPLLGAEQVRVRLVVRR